MLSKGFRTLVASVYNPVAWAAYTYCRGNPSSFVDPDSHEFWRTFTVIVTFAALVSLTIFTAGAGSALTAPVIIGMIAGGIGGGITAARVKGHEGRDVAVFRS